MKTFANAALLAILAFVCVQTDTRAQGSTTYSRMPGEGGFGGRHVSPAATQAASRLLTADPLPAGAYTVGKGGSFASIDSAFDRLSGGGILGPVTLLLTDTLYVASSSRNGAFALHGPVVGAGPSSRITIRPSENVAVTIRGDGEGVLWFDNVGYVTVDGISLQGGTRMKVHSVYNAAPPYNDAIDLSGNCDHAVIQNLTALSEDNRKAYTICIYSDNVGAPDSCLVSGVFIPSGMMGIVISGEDAAHIRPKGCVIRGNRIGSPTDSLLSRGIQDQFSDGTIIEENQIENIRAGHSLSSTTKVAAGIVSYCGRNVVIRSNLIHNVCGTIAPAYVQGILLAGETANWGSNNWVYNNMVYDIRTRVSASTMLAGIHAWYQDFPRVDHNSVLLVESGDATPAYGSGGLWFLTTTTSPTARNNILINLRDDTPYASDALGFGVTPLVSDHNDLYVGPFAAANITSTAATRYKTLPAWQSTGNDAHSMSVLPTFRSPLLHLDSTSTADGQLHTRAIAISGITTDFDGQSRHPSTPDIGADECVFTTGVNEEVPERPSVFALQQNYPNPFNPSTVLSYQLPVASHVMLAVYDLLGREVAVLTNERKGPGSYTAAFDGAGLSSGFYFCRLSAGAFCQVRKLALVR